MKTSKFTDEQIALALRQAEAGTPAGEICRKLGVSEQSFYRRKNRFGALGVSELHELRPLREENRKLKRCTELGRRTSCPSVGPAAAVGSPRARSVPRFQLGMKVVIVEKLFKIDEQSSRVRRIGVRSTAGESQNGRTERHRLAK
jgi:putative transposase